MLSEMMEMKTFLVKPIGVVHVSLSDDEIKAKFEGVEGVVEIYEEYAQGLEGIDGFSYLIIVAYLHKVFDEQRRILRVKPRGLRRLGMNLAELPEVGVFSTDSPHRPNPLALTIVELVRREGDT